MPHRTFFLLRRDVATGALQVDARTTYQDISDRLTVAQVDARIDGVKLTEEVVRGLFPEALQAAKDYQGMKQRAAADNATMGPFKITTEDPPTDPELLAWHKALKEHA